MYSGMLPLSSEPMALWTNPGRRARRLHLALPAPVLRGTHGDTSTTGPTILAACATHVDLRRARAECGVASTRDAALTLRLVLKCCCATHGAVVHCLLQSGSRVITSKQHGCAGVAAKTHGMSAGPAGHTPSRRPPRTIGRPG